MYNTLLQKRLWQSCNLNSYCLMLIILADLLLLGSCGCVQASLWSLQMLAGFCICSFLLAWHYACPVDIVIKMDERIELVFSMEASSDLSCPVFFRKISYVQKGHLPVKPVSNSFDVENFTWLVDRYKTAYIPSTVSSWIKKFSMVGVSALTWCSSDRNGHLAIILAHRNVLYLSS